MAKKKQKPELSIHNLHLLNAVVKLHRDIYEAAAEGGPESKILSHKTMIDGIKMEIIAPSLISYYKTEEGN